MRASAIDTMSDMVRFFYNFIRSPRQTGSITPSSSFLARAMLKEINWKQVETVVELGAGTGVFTKRIVQEMPKESRTIIFERNPVMRERLEQRYPGLIIRDNATDLVKTIHELGIVQVDAIISGLPFANFPQTVRDEILTGVAQVLKPNGIFVTFQYSLQMKKQLERQFSTVHLSYVPLNVPPAVVYTCYR